MSDDKKVTLSDLADDPSLISGLTPKAAGKLYDEAEAKDIRLAGTALSELYYRSIADETPASKEDQATAKAAADGHSLAN